MKMMIAALCSLQLISYVAAQKPAPLKGFQQIPTLDLLWEINNTDITYLGSNGDIFYKIMLLSVPANTPETDEIKKKVILLAGESGETPDGKLYDLGDYFNVENPSIDIATKKISFLARVGCSTELIEFDLP